MPTRTPIPVSRAMRQISANLDLARRQQRIPVALLAERAGLSMPTVTKMLRTGNGSFENFLRIARLLGLLDGVQQATDSLNTDIGNYAPTKTLQNVFDSTAGGATHHGSNRHPAVQRHRRHRREIIHQYQARHRIGTFHIRYGLYALFKRSIPLSRDAPLPPERSRPSIMRCIASFKTACRIVGAGTSCFVQNIKMLVRSIAQHAHYLREISCYPSTMRPDKAHCASGTTTVTR